MNYCEYEKTVDNFNSREDCKIISFDTETEPSFSWFPCDICGSRLGGDRYNVTIATHKNITYNDFRGCSHCLYYNEYGKLDDITMMEIENNPDFTVG